MNNYLDNLRALPALLLIIFLIVYFFVAHVGALIIVGYQVYQYLKTGDWLPMSALEVFGSDAFQYEWIANPSDWYGVSEVAVWIITVPSFPVLLIASYWSIVGVQRAYHRYLMCRVVKLAKEAVAPSH